MNSNAQNGGLDLSIPPIPPRSRLFSLEPIGIGTAYVESLTGYATRLAEAHCVEFGRLVVGVIAPVIKKGYLLSNKGASFSVRFGITATSVNSMGVTARDWVNAIQGLTLRENLTSLTMLPWANTIDRRNLIRRVRAWCPACYEDWRVNGERVYEPLLWSLAVILGCPIHNQPLTEVCPSCGMRLPALSSRSRPGYCSKCGNWLGTTRRSGSTESMPNEEMSGYHMWVAEHLGGMLAATPGLPSAPKNGVTAEIVSACIQKLTKGKVKEFAQRMGETGSGVWSWLRHGVRPVIGTLLIICYKAGLSPEDFFTRANDANSPDEKIRRSVKYPHYAYSSEELREVEARLRPILAEDPPVCKAEAARRIGCSLWVLERRFPELVSVLNERYAAHRRNIFDKTRWLGTLRAAGEEVPPPSLAEVARRLGCSVALLRLHFREECRVVVERYKLISKKFFYSEGLEEKVEQFLDRSPPPSLTACAAEIGCSLCTLRRSFPNLCDEIAARYAESRRRSTEQKRREQRRMITEAIESLRTQGIKPTAWLVRQLLPVAPLYVVEISSLIRESKLQAGKITN